MIRITSFTPGPCPMEVSSEGATVDGFLSPGAQSLPSSQVPLIGIMPVHGEWATLEASNDLRTWKEILAVRTVDRVHLFADASNYGVPHAFYRAASGQPGLTELRNRWQGSEIADYRFRVSGVALVAPAGTEYFTAEVVVQNGVKSVSDFEILLGSGVNFDPSDVPSVEELLDLLDEAESLADELAAQGEPFRGVWFGADPETGLPRTAGFDFWTADGGWGLRGYSALRFDFCDLEILRLH